GQVAVLSSGALGPSEAVDLLDSLRASAMYRADQNSYMLYPNRQLPRFLDKNRIPEEALQSAPLLAQLAHQKNSILDRDAQGTYRFAPDLFNAKKLREALVALVGPPSEDQIAQALEVYEQVFQHHFFTGRS